MYKIIHIDMDAFYAAVEIRDNSELAKKPVIIGSLPSERGVVATCNYEARAYGVRSAMNIKEAYRLCPKGFFMRPNMRKYKKASEQIHQIWKKYTDIYEFISLDEGFLDISNSEHLFGGATQIAREIKKRTLDEVGLTCSVGIGYSMMSAKLASEEKKPDGFFQILNPTELNQLIANRSTRVIYGIGAKTAEKLQLYGINTVRDIQQKQEVVLKILGKSGRQVVDLAFGIDERQVTPAIEAKSIGNEHTFQKNITDFDYIGDFLLLLSRKLSHKIQLEGLFCETITLKITYADMAKITRSKTISATNNSQNIYKIAVELLAGIERRAIRLVGLSLSNFETNPITQIELFSEELPKQSPINSTILELKQKYGEGIIKTANELRAQNRVSVEP